MSQRKPHSAFVATKWMTGSSYVSFITGAINSVIVTHALGPQVYGVYSYLIWMITFSVGLSSGGLNITAIRVISSLLGKDADHISTASLGALALLRKILAAILVMLCAALALSGLFPGIYPNDVAAHLAGYLAFVLFCGVIKSHYMLDISSSKGFLFFQTEALTNSITSIAGVFAGLALLYTHQGLNAYLALFSVIALVQLVMARVIMRRHGLRSQAVQTSEEVSKTVRGTLRWNILFSLVGQLSSKSIDTYLLGLQSLTVAVGHYNIAANLSKAGSDVLSAGFSSMLLPYISRAQAEGGKARVQEIFLASVCFYQGVGIVLAGAGYLLANAIILTLYGHLFAAAIPALRVMSLMGGLTLPLAAYSAVFIATDSFRLRIGFIVASSAISLTTSLLFVPTMGYRGALISILIGGSLNYIIIAIGTYAAIGLRFPLRQVGVQALCALAPLVPLSTLAPVQTSPLAALASAFVFGLVFVVLSVNLGGWRREDLLAAAAQSSALARLLGWLRWRAL